MALSISEFKFDFNHLSFVEFWTRIQELLNNKYGHYSEIFKYELNKIKQKDLNDFYTAKKEAIVLQKVIWKILYEYYNKTPLEIFVEFFETIRKDCFQGGYGHHILITRPKDIFLTDNENIKYKEFFKVILSDNIQKNSTDEWPHHYVLHTNAFYKVKLIDVEVYFALIALDCYMSIEEKADNEMWCN
jgi:hypothetical protein